MREVNFSIPNVNKASVGITPALYDRRALDCTSTLPLINSLNHLAYLTTSSARIRDILTMDGGVERLVCILKHGRSREMMEMWKWNLAFQCVWNIGVRGSEGVRTRVVEADMVPVIATILDNYSKVIDKCRERAEADARRALRYPAAKVMAKASKEHARPGFHERAASASESRPVRRQPPPPDIAIVHTVRSPLPPHDLTARGPGAPAPPQLALTSPPLDRAALSPHPPPPHHPPHHHHHHHHHRRSQEARPPGRHGVPPPALSLPSMDASELFGLRPVRDVDRLPSMLPALQNGITSQPESPTTPNAPILRPMSMDPRPRRRPSLRQRLSHSGESDGDSAGRRSPDHPSTTAPVDEPLVDIHTTVDLPEGDERATMLDAVATPLALAGPNGSDGPEVERFNITHRTPLDGSINTTLTTPPHLTDAIGLPTVPPPTHVIHAPLPSVPHNVHARYLLERSAPPGVLAATPRDEDVIMSLQLLAYVSKYCALRSYFQQSHLVPKLKIGQHLHLLDEHPPSTADATADAAASNEDEYLLPDDFNIFPLVEKFTVRHHSADMQYWAGVVMRNLCRKDDSRGGIRQCAYYQCGKWEQYQRQFAKCRRCRRTKYCSKDCQKNAWVFHRHWCQVANQQ